MNRNLPLTELPSQVDDLDRLLSRFYQSEMPAPWPAAPRPEATARPMPASRLPGYERPRQLVTGPRAALAASVALLLGSCWFLSNQTGEVAVPQHGGATATEGKATKKFPHEIGKAPKESESRRAIP
jgi:hypothetical protein